MPLHALLSSESLAVLCLLHIHVFLVPPKERITETSDSVQEKKAPLSALSLREGFCLQPFFPCTVLVQYVLF